MISDYIYDFSQLRCWPHGDKPRRMRRWRRPCRRLVVGHAGAWSWGGAAGSARGARGTGRLGTRAESYLSKNGKIRFFAEKSCLRRGYFQQERMFHEKSHCNFRMLDLRLGVDFVVARQWVRTFLRELLGRSLDGITRRRAKCPGGLAKSSRRQAPWCRPGRRTRTLVPG